MPPIHWSFVINHHKTTLSILFVVDLHELVHDDYGFGDGFGLSVDFGSEVIALDCKPFGLHSFDEFVYFFAIVE